MDNVNKRKLLDEWFSFNRQSLPEECRDVELNGISLVLLDAVAAGCICSFISRGAMDADRQELLSYCRHCIETVIPDLFHEGESYFRRLHHLAGEMLEYAQNNR